jgi:cardiolipin synthase
VRGVKVQLVLPTRSDSPLALWAGRSFYEELLEAGVEIFEFDAGVLHSKILSVDERWSMLGSANMDVRSFRLNFEITALLYDAAVAKRIDDDIEAFIARSRPITRPIGVSKGFVKELAEGVARLFAPLL